MKYALIGCGRIARKHLSAAIENNYEIVAICDVSQEARTKLLMSFDEGIRVNEYDDFENMLRQESDLEIVAIATPSGSHYTIGLECIKHGIHVIIEKPVAMTLAQARTLTEMVKAYEVHGFVCHQKRYNTAIQYIKKLIVDGELGSLLHIMVNVLWNRNEEYYKQAAWRGTWENDGGVLMNQGIHSIDIMNWFSESNATKVTSMFSNSNHQYIECEDFISAIVQFENGIMGTINVTSNVNPVSFEESIYVCGTKGFAKISGKSMSKIEYLQISGKSCLLPEKIKAESNKDIYGNGHATLYAKIKQYLLDGEQECIKLEEGYSALELVLGIYQSALRQCFLNFPIQPFSLDNMPNLNDI